MVIRFILGPRVPNASLMSEAKAAIDIKGRAVVGRRVLAPAGQTADQGAAIRLLGHSVRRPIGTAIAFEYFQSRGLLLATPDDPTRWFSREYWEETKRFAEDFRPQLSLETIGRPYEIRDRGIGTVPLGAAGLIRMFHRGGL